MDQTYKVPLIARGRIFDDCTETFGGRQGGVRFQTPAAGRYLRELTACTLEGMTAYQATPIEEIARFLHELGRMLDFDHSPELREAYQLSATTSGISDGVLEFIYRSVASRLFNHDNVMEYAEKRIGLAYLEGWVETPMRDGSSTSIRAFGSRCAHVIAGNTPGVAFNTVLRSAVTRSDCITKTPSNDPLTMAAILRAMIRLDPRHVVTRHMSCAYWKGGDAAFEERFYTTTNIEKIVAWGGFDSVKHITRYLQPGLDLITLDPKHSASIVGREALRDDVTMADVARRAALDVGLYNQEACANARITYVECDVEDPQQLERLNRFGELMYQALQTLPAHLSTRAKYVSAALKEELDGLWMLDDYYKVWRDDDTSGAVIVSQNDEAVPFAAELACRTVNVVPVRSVDDAIRRVNASTQTIGVWPTDLKRRIRNALALRGGQMIVSLGYVARLNSNGPMDGIEPERRMLKWVVDQSPNENLPPPWQIAAT
jgi:acyl-CoA reductase-like NAD-dependent aldehyde dehydrogenase